MDKLRLGAINKETNQYESIIFALKTNKYQCPDCNKTVILRKGEINRPHFSHKKESGCTYYEKPNESQIHKDAKMLTKILIEQNKLEVYKKCEECKKCHNIHIPEFDEKKRVILEHNFKFDKYEQKEDEDGELKIADVALLDENKIEYIFEIFNTHITEEGNRPEPWCEINAINLLKQDVNNDKKIKVECCRSFTCDNCLEKKFNELDKLHLNNLILNKDFEFYIRYKLGQRHFIESNFKKEHLRFNFHAIDKISRQNNINILNLFNKFYENKKVILISDKGLVWVKFIYNNEYDNNEHNYNQNFYECGSFELNTNNNFVQFSGIGTVNIIKYILENIQKEYVEIIYNNKKDDKYYYNLINERIYLSVNYDDKDDIKNNGGLWDIEHKRWYILRTHDKLNNILKKYKQINIYVKKIEKNFNDNFKLSLKNKKNITISDYKNIYTQIINKELNNYETSVYNQDEINKKLYSESYYKKYHKALLSIKNRIINYNDPDTRTYIYKYNIQNWTTEANWGGWGNDNNYLLDGCSKQCLKKFMKNYNLINPVTLVKNILEDV